VDENRDKRIERMESYEKERKGKGKGHVVVDREREKRALIASMEGSSKAATAAKIGRRRRRH
jgi:hypothetical protein